MPRKELPLFYYYMKKNNPDKYIEFLERENITLLETIEAYRQTLQRIHYAKVGDSDSTLSTPRESTE